MKVVFCFSVLLLILLFCLAPVQAQTNLTKYGVNPVLDEGPEFWDGWGAYSASVIFDGVVYKMWYTGSNGSAWHAEVGYATSTDGKLWTKHVNNPVFKLGTSGSWDSSLNNS